MSRFIIYGLIDPRDGELFYVGRSMSGASKMKRHVQPWSLKRGCKAKNDRILDILNNGGYKPTFVVIEECRNKKQLIMKERIWIAHFSKHYNLTNVVGNFNRRKQYVRLG